MTKTDFINLTLRNIKRINVGQSASATDVSAAIVVYNSIYDWLSNQSLVAWGIDDDLPDWAVMPMKKIVSPDLAREFSVNENRIAFFEQEKNLGFMDLLRANTQDWSDEVTEAEYF